MPPTTSGSEAKFQLRQRNRWSAAQRYMHMHMRHTVNNMTDEVALERACGTLPVALFVYDVPVTDADQLDPTFPSDKWSVLRAFVELAQKSAYQTRNPACANVFLIPIATDQYARQHGLSRARQLDERGEMRRVGPWWDTVAGLSGGCSGSGCCNWLLGLRRLGWRVEGLSFLEVEGAVAALKSGRC